MKRAGWWVAARVVVLVVVVVPAVAWFVVKPVRVLVPQWTNVTCNAEKTLCVDDASRFDEARMLREEALAFVSGRVGAIAGQPRIVLCTKQTCADEFGLSARSAVTIGTFGTVIGPRAWKPYYVRHELIHYLQAERLGVLALMFKPQWWVEGMAYSMSEDPRERLAEPWQGERQQFRKWLATVGVGKLWDPSAQ